MEDILSDFDWSCYINLVNSRFINNRVGALQSNGAFNLSCAFASLLLSIWCIRLFEEYRSITRISKALNRNQKVVHLNAMAEYAGELVRLSRHHFNQILRYKHKIKPLDMPRIRMPLAVEPKTLTISTGSVSSTGPNSKVGISFNFDCNKTTFVTAHWGVPVDVVEAVVIPEKPEHTAESFTNSKGFLRLLKRVFYPLQGEPSQALLNNANGCPDFESPVTRGELSLLGGGTTFCTSEPICFDAGNNIECTVEPPVDKVLVNSEQVDIWGALANSNDRISLALVLYTPKSYRVTHEGNVTTYQGFAQVTLINIRRSKSEISGQFKLQVWKQIAFCGDISPQEPRDMFGMGDDMDQDCLICIANKMDTVLLPCGHSSFCSSCLAALRNEKCPVCRSEFDSFIKLPLKRIN